MVISPYGTSQTLNARVRSTRNAAYRATSPESPSGEEPALKKRRESRREKIPARHRFSSAAAAAAAVVHGDGFKPREERGWEEFHQDLDIEARFPIFSAHDVDGVPRNTAISSSGISDIGSRSRRSANVNGESHHDASGRRTPSAHDEAYASPSPRASGTTPRRRPGRPPRRSDSMLKGIGPSPDAPKIVPLPGFNPREKLTLPKPTFRSFDPFEKFEDREDYVDKSMARIGYQESEIYTRPKRMLIRVTEGNIEEDLDVGHDCQSDFEKTAVGSLGLGRVEYDMDEQDIHWLDTHNQTRKEEGLEPIKTWQFEITMTIIEKEWHTLEKRIPKPNPKPPQTHRPRSSSAAAVNGELAGFGEEQDTKCAICDDGDCENTNAIVFCDGCDLAVHQECYGVPFIPEGQWLCRKCQLIGRGTPTCIFCPNTDGAFKQTNASRWSHLLCAIWIPEVSIGNTTFMEPVMDVEKVPKQRWKLTCYVCRQKMGACIQCGNKNCYIAFHVSCARKAKLFLKMKSTHGGPANLDASVLKAFCDKHVPADWRREQNVDNAISEAMEFYRRSMRGRLWADSQQSALTTMPAPPQDIHTADSAEDPSGTALTLNFHPNKRKNEPQRIVWKLPSGAPVIPQTLYNSVENSLQRFMIRKRREFAAETCKYWTLKREARRGAALLKRLQVQMETFTSMEITRRNFVGMGAAGGVRLQRRIDFSDILLKDVERLRQLCTKIREREQEKLQDAEMLKGIVHSVYFPLPPLLWPVLEKAQSLDNKNMFQTRFSILKAKLSSRMYSSTNGFVKDLGAILGSTSDVANSTGTTETQSQVEAESPIKGTLHDPKYRKSLVKKILKALQPLLEDVVHKESQLQKKPYDIALQEMKMQLEDGLKSCHFLSDDLGNAQICDNESDKLQVGVTPVDGAAKVIRAEEDHGNLEDIVVDPAITHLSRQHRKSNEVELSNRATKRSRRRPTPESIATVNGVNGGMHSFNDALDNRESSPNGKMLATEPPTPPLSMSSRGGMPFPNQGGVPWYMESFNPDGTTIEEERWTGRDLVRSMSEELSDMDEDKVEELSELVGADDVEATKSAQKSKDAAIIKKRKAATKRRRTRSFR